MITANAISAVHCTLNTALGCTMSWLIASSAPAAPQPIAATTKTSILARPTRAPELRAATSSSRMAVSTRPSLPRSSRYTVTSARTVTASPIQYVSASSSAVLMLGVCGSDMPVPPPMEGNFSMISKTVVAQHPGGDREVPAAQPGNQPPHRQGGDPAADCRDRKRGEHRDAVDVQDQHEVRAEPHERLLPHRYQARVAGQQVPHAGQCQHDERLHHDAGGAGVHDVGEQREHDNDDERAEPGPGHVSP